MIAGVTNGSHFSAVSWSSTQSFQVMSAMIATIPTTVATAVIR